MMRGVSEIVPLARQFPGIVQIAQALPVGFIRLVNPVLAGYSDFEKASIPVHPPHYFFPSQTPRKGAPS